VPGHWLLNLEGTTGYLWSFTYVGYFFGPVLSRTLMQACLSQRALAASLGALLLGLAAGQELVLGMLLALKPGAREGRQS